MIRREIGVCCLMVALAGSVAAQQRKALSNQYVIGLVDAGLDDATIIKAIQMNPADFDLSAPGLIALKTGNVSGSVMQAMIERLDLGMQTPLQKDRLPPQLNRQQHTGAVRPL